MIYKTLTACAFVFVTSSAQAQSLDELFGNIFKPRYIERDIVRPLKRGVRAVEHSGNMVKTTWYQSGHRTANGERFNPNGMTVAHKTLPFGTRVRFTNPKNGRTVITRVSDRGPFRKGYSYDLARGAARAIGMTGTATLHAHVLQ